MRSHLTLSPMHRVATTALTPFLALLLVAAGAPAAEARTVTLEAEKMTAEAVGANSAKRWLRIVVDRRASRERALRYRAKVAASARVRTRRTGRLTIRARGDQCHGRPKARVAIDGRHVASIPVGSRSWANYSRKASLGAGRHRVQVAFSNNRFTANCNRNLYLDRIRFTSRKRAAPLSTLAAPLPLPSAEPPDWTADAELPIHQQWYKHSTIGGDGGVRNVERVTAPVAQGGYAYKFTINDGDTPTTADERVELAQQGMYHFNPPSTIGDTRGFQVGEERWISFQVRFDNTWDPYATAGEGFNNFMQLKHAGEGGPSVSMQLQGGILRLKNIPSSEQTDTRSVSRWATPWSPGVHRDRWLRFTLHMTFSPDPRVGFIALYGDLDGRGMVELLPKVSTQTMKLADGTSTPLTVYPRIGIYRDVAISGTANLYHDGYAVARTRAGAEAAAFR